MAHIVRTAAGRRCQTSKGKFTKNSRCGIGARRVSKAMHDLGYLDTKYLLLDKKGRGTYVSGSRKGKQKNVRHFAKAGVRNFKLANGKTLQIVVTKHKGKCGPCKGRSHKKSTALAKRRTGPGSYSPRLSYRFAQKKCGKCGLKKAAFKACVKRARAGGKTC